jgi:uncharacterized protein YerC
MAGRMWQIDKFQKITKDGDREARLFLALYGLGSPIDIRNFMLDLLTDKELRSLSNRLEAARLLAEGESY